MTVQREEANYAGFWIRLAANFLDFILFHIPFAIIIFYLTGDFNIEWASQWYWELLYYSYLTILPIFWSGYIIGKRICRIRVCNNNGQRLTFFQMLIREVLIKYALAMLTFGLVNVASIMMMIIRKDKRGIHDLAAGTYVTHAIPIQYELKKSYFN